MKKLTDTSKNSTSAANLLAASILKSSLTNQLTPVLRFSLRAFRPHKRLFRNARTYVALLLGFIPALAFAEGETQTVTVRSVSKDATIAQSEAMAKGEREALRQLAKEIESDADVDKISAAKITALVKSMQIESESATNKGYKASISYKLDIDSAKTLLGSAPKKAKAEEATAPSKPDAPVENSSEVRPAQKQVMITRAAPQNNYEGAPATPEIMVLSPITSVDEWVALRRMIEGIQGVQSVNISAFSLAQVDFMVGYSGGNITSLSNAMRGIGLNASAEAKYIVINR